ncbi:malonyl-coenzyme:anthocyanin 5-o-glucoside-6'''-o-malonyltransferase [Phtheirospermum japonicum]|uniref:Malonyl-coenzyme:anthocyanin 5-o-glucoside-6'''-o-malonyltransferase n=1 Tax=Phtheirospermum japonicum TaxID=374723 RepID=A0A830D9X1_9LAMI|nr:malonyl-coenzyme:anthocyanin 5-o-glucoside-6'''-o-malonyltransferase [Phtheirospermum japonicum]
MCIMRMRFCVVPRSGRRSTGSLSESGSMGWRDRRGSTSTQRITGGERLRSLKHYSLMMVQFCRYANPEILSQKV